MNIKRHNVQARAEGQIHCLLQSALVALCAGKSGSESPRRSRGLALRTERSKG